MNIDKYIGMKFGRLTITGIAPTPPHIKTRSAVYVYCYCECNPEKTLVRNLTNIIYGGTRSCGCYRYDEDKTYDKKKTRYDLSNDYGIGIDSKGRTFYFSLEDYERIKKYTWTVHPTRHEVINHKTGMKLHRFVLNVNDSNLQVDHINHNRTDNRRENLRVVTSEQNNMNKNGNKYTNVFRGISWNKKLQKWVARITVHYKGIHLGVFQKLEDAIRARKEAEEKYFGEYSYDNSQHCIRQYAIQEDTG